MSIFRALVVIAALYKSYTIRLYAVEVYGRVIHEFDPWFNYRATEYMAANGWDKFQVRGTRLRSGLAPESRPRALRRVIIPTVSFVVAPTNCSEDNPFLGSPPINRCQRASKHVPRSAEEAPSPEAWRRLQL